MDELRVKHGAEVFTLTVDPELFVLPRSAASGQAENISQFVLSWLELISDSPLGTKPRRTYANFLKKAYSSVKDLVLQYSDLSHKLVSNMTLMGSGTLIGEWIGDDFKDTPVFYEYARLYHTGDLSLLGYLYTFLNFGKKLEFMDKAFEDVALRDWLEIERELSDLKFDEDDLVSMRMIITRLLAPLNSEEFWPKHGPGSVAERGVRDAVMKHNFVGYDRILDRVFFRGYYSSFGLRKEDGFSAESVLPDTDIWDPDKPVDARVAQVHFAVKNLKTARSVCMEPAVLMYFQQGVMDQAIRVIDKTPYSRFIRLSDQARNQRLSLIGSYTGEIDTIDLSAASDRLSLQLVKRIFPASWLIPMLATRSTSAKLPDGSVRPLNKFAPMGSAMCFPTQCIVFASACIYAAHLWRLGLAPTSMAPMSPYDVHLALGLFEDEYKGYVYGSRKLKPLAVYGDDICIDYRLSAYILAILGRLGFKVNVSKSFTNVQAFRESCGMYSLNGVDITPLYYRVKGNAGKLSPAFLSSQVHLANEAWRRGFKHLYRSCVRRLMRGNKSIPFIRDTSEEFGIFCSWPRNNHLRSRENSNLQRTEYRVWTISRDSSKASDSRHESYLYMRWKADSRRPDHSGLPVKSKWHDVSIGHKIKWRWTPLY
jgi:hypothetical protein